ncbi:MAG: mechanosensitive ion channel family protein [Candidatus Obscuribacter sp.]|nr:mechanosensitive ion channel family protein [Candidatus Obscuribacter sp.]
MQGVASDLVCGVFLQMTRRFNVGDNIAIIGMDVKGKIVDVHYLSTLIKVEGGMISIPNRDMWSKPTKVNDPPKSTIIMPDGHRPDKSSERR